MSFDLEHYARVYGELGDTDIQGLLHQAAILSRHRGRPEILFLDENSQTFREQQELLQTETQRRRITQQKLVAFFLHEAPESRKVSLARLTPLFREEIGKDIPNDLSTSYLFLPANRRASDNVEDQLLLQRSLGISPHVKGLYNRYLQIALRAGLFHVGDIRNVMNFVADTNPVTSPIPADHINIQTAAFLYYAFSIQ